MMAALRDQVRSGFCPRCAAPTLFEGGVRVAAACPDCGPDFAALRPRDRYLALTMMLTVVVLTAGALAIDGGLSLPLPIVLPVMAALSIAATLLVLRAAAGIGVAIGYARGSGGRGA